LGGGDGFGGAVGPGTGLGGGAGGGGGGYTNPRGPTSRVELKIDWKFPTYVEKVESKDGKTTAVQARRALSPAEAFSYLAGDDRRPLLVLRECLKCNGTDDALMTRNADNERTLLMSRWFHCVKLPPDVLEEDHPFHVLFDGDKPGHLFFSRWDGTGRKDLTGQQSRTELWQLMGSYLASDYEKGADGSVKALVGLLDRFDRIDADMAEAKDEIDELIEKGQGESNKIRKLQDKIAELEAAKTRARADAVKLSELKLKQQTAPKSAQVPAPAGVGQG
jgi:hypothetical protein